MSGILGGIFVGGSSRRFGGIAKGLLAAPDGSPSIVERTAALLRKHGVEPVLVGRHAEYSHLEIPFLDDEGDALGPLGGFLALYARAGKRRVLALACDMPFVASIARLVATDAPLLAARRDERWEPFFSSHDPAVVAPIAEAHATARRLSLQALFDAVPARGLVVDRAELDDWDAPEDRS